MAENTSISIPQHLFQRIQELARLRKLPVNEVLIDVLDQALPPNGSIFGIDEDEAMEREMQAYILLHPGLKEKYLGQHVAIYGGNLIDHDHDFATLYDRIEAKYPNEFVWLATVEEDAMPTLVFRSPRFFPATE